MTVLERPQGTQIEVRERRENYAKFVIEPLDRGFGITLGNALRRVLLSSIPGAAVTYVKIDSVLHEFSTIPGVVEDTVDLLLNLKGLPLKLNTDDPKVLTLNVSGSREVTAGDISPDADVEILQPDYHIATLTKKDAKLVDGDRRREIARLRYRRPPEEHRAHDRADPDGLDLLADPQGQLHRRRYARRAVGRLRPPDPRDRDQRFDHAGRRALGSREHLHRSARRCSSTSRPKRSRSRRRRPASGTSRSKPSTCRSARSTASSGPGSRRSRNCST